MHLQGKRDTKYAILELIMKISFTCLRNLADGEQLWTSSKRNYEIIHNLVKILLIYKCNFEMQIEKSMNMDVLIS